MGGGPVAARAQHADGVRVVDRQRGTVALRDLEQVRDVGDVPFHRVDTVHDDHAAGPGGHLLQPALQPRQVAVIEAHRLAVGHLGAVHDGRVVELVEEHHVPPAHQPRDEPQVGLIAGREDEAGLLAEELGQLPLESFVQVERPVQEAAAGTAGAVPLQRLLRGREDLRMMREPQVVVGAHHDPLFALDHDDGVFGVRDRPEVGIEAGSLKLPRLGETLALVEQCNVLQGLGAHGAPGQVGE